MNRRSLASEKLIVQHETGTKGRSKARCLEGCTRWLWKLEGGALHQLWEGFLGWTYLHLGRKRTSPRDAYSRQKVQKEPRLRYKNACDICGVRKVNKDHLCEPSGKGRPQSRGPDG